MDILPLIITLALVGGTLALVLYPLWRQTRPAGSFGETISGVGRPGRTLEEYDARYQAALAAIKDLMFDYEMGKVSAEDYEMLLTKSKLEAAQIRRQIDLLSQSTTSKIDPEIEAKIESLVAEFKNSGLNGNEALLQNVETEIEALKNIQPDSQTGFCPHCGRNFQMDDAFCSGCGQSLADVKTNKNACPECGSAIQPDDTFCAKCGVVLDSKLTTRSQKTSR